MTSLKCMRHHLGDSRVIFTLGAFFAFFGGGIHL